MSSMDKDIMKILLKALEVIRKVKTAAVAILPPESKEKLINYSHTILDKDKQKELEGLIDKLCEGDESSDNFLVLCGGVFCYAAFLQGPEIKTAREPARKREGMLHTCTQAGHAPPLRAGWSGPSLPGACFCLVLEAHKSNIASLLRLNPANNLVLRAVASRKAVHQEDRRRAEKECKTSVSRAPGRSFPLVVLTLFVLSLESALLTHLIRPFQGDS